MLESDAIPYYYCDKCARLSPAMGSPNTTLVCLVCSKRLVPKSAGRPVFLSEKEANIRNLQWRLN